MKESSVIHVLTNEEKEKNFERNALDWSHHLNFLWQDKDLIEALNDNLDAKKLNWSRRPDFYGKTRILLKP
jgi:hypothetical protein